MYSSEDVSMEEEIPWNVLEFGLQQRRPLVKDLSIASKDDEVRSYLADRAHMIDSVLFLPVASPESSKQKVIYIENHEVSIDSLGIDIRMLDLIGQQLAGALDSSRLFHELEELNESLEGKVAERTRELNLKTVLLERAKNEAIQAAAAKSLFLSNMSHEIRTPISQVILAAELLSDSTEFNAETDELVNIVINSGKVLLNLVNDILDLSKLENGSVKAEAIKFDIHQMIQVTMDAFATKEGVTLAYYIQKDTPRWIIGDETRLRQIITNLVSNGIKFTSKGHVMLFVFCQVVESELIDVRFEVTDTGIGITSDKLDKIFERFEQEDATTTRKFGGTGLGLAISQSLCKLMGSTITVLSEVNRGSTFQFTLRMQNGKPDPSQLSSPVHIHILNSSPKILLLEETKASFKSNSPLHWQLLTMGASVDPWSDQNHSHNHANFDNYKLVIVDFASFDSVTAVNPKIVNIIKNQIIPVIIIYSSDQIDIIYKTMGSTNHTTNALRYPYKQSSLYRLLFSLLPEGKQENDQIDVQEYNAGPVPSVRNKNDNIQKIDILLAEDDEVNQEIIKLIVNKMGYSVDVAENGLVACEMVKKKHYHLILMDARMPVMDGSKATKNIRSYYSRKEMVLSNTQSTSNLIAPTEKIGENRTDDITSNDYPPIKKSNISYNDPPPIIVGLSADALPENQQAGLKAGMDFYLTKPVSQSNLAELINMVEQNI
ncbi:hypothetical protein BKA69DRAFT_1036697 [Paraphysoderma sedebokerense]|nr:hypothetical protein BKA69DRAFT_1036697 [Paraphysoderma sedebokerense]